ncbi:MAG: sugar phosphate isomerase/epimerase family protein [Anaerocolumna sp.]
MEISIIVDDKLTYIEEYISIGITNFEITLNEDPTYFIKNIKTIEEKLKKENVKIASLGQWGSLKIINGKINEKQIEVDKQLINICMQLGTTIFITGVNRDEILNEEENNKLAIRYLSELVNYAENVGVTVCIYNCDWNNYILNESKWTQIINEVPKLKIKYDPSHAFYRNQNYLEELENRISDIGHFHVKGGMKINNTRYDDPPAFMDQIDWNSIFGILNIENYNGYVSIEPHSLNIKKEKIINGVSFTFKKLNEFIL